jgi:hypothetical protein
MRSSPEWSCGLAACKSTWLSSGSYAHAGLGRSRLPGGLLERLPVCRPRRSASGRCGIGHHPEA